MLDGDACSRPPITIRSHNLHAGDIRGAMGEITFYQGLAFSFFLVLAGCTSFGLSLAFPFCLPMMVPTINLLLDFCEFYCIPSLCIKVFQFSLSLL